MFKGKLYEFNGEMLSIKTVAGRVSLAPSTIYKYLNKGLSLYDAIDQGKKQSDKVFKTRPKTNNVVAKKYQYKDALYTVKEIASLEGISPEPIYRYLKKGYTVEEAVATIKSNISKKYPYMGMMLSIYKIAMLSGVPDDYLKKNIDDSIEYKEEDIMEIVEGYTKRPILMKDGMSLYLYCINNQLNYNAIYYSIKIGGLSIDDAIADYVMNGQMHRFGFEYDVGSILLYHFAIKEQLDDRYLKYRIGLGDSIEDAIIATIFLSKENFKDRKRRGELHDMYKNGVSPTEQDEIDFIKEKDLRVKKVLKDYHAYIAIYELQKTLPWERKIVLQQHGLTESDIEDLSPTLYENFVDIDEEYSKKKIEYVWHKK